MKNLSNSFLLLLFSCLGCFPAKGIKPTNSNPLKTSNLYSKKINKKTNFILIVADDLGFGDLSVNGSTQIKTPHIDQLAKTGINCSEGYVSAPVCSPSRAGFLTGKNQVSFGYDNNIGGSQPGFDPQFLGLPLTEKTLADHLKPLGYINGLIGKWHLGAEPQFHPLKRGFDEFWGYTGGGHDYFASDPNSKRAYDIPIQSNYKTPQTISYLTDDKGDECVDFINRHQDQAFFLFASFNAPHTPMQALDKDLALFQHIPDKKRRTYAAMVHRLDVNVGKIVAAVKQANIANHTMIIFISDNGGPVYSNASLNAPYRGQKGILLEGGIHVPFIINYPQFPKGILYKKPVSALDLAPTLIHLATNTTATPSAAATTTSAATNFTGLNLSPYLLNQEETMPPRSLKWRFTISAAIREGDWKLIRLPDRLPQLYHLPSDTTEQHNLALEKLEKTEALLKKLGNWDVQLPHPVFLEGAIWKKRQLELYDRNYQLKQLRE